MSDKLYNQLLADKIITKKQYQDALDLKQSVGGTLDDILVKLNYITEEALGRFKAKLEGMDFQLLDNFEPTAAVMSILSKDKIINEQVVPIKMDDNYIFLAMSHPEHVDIISEIEFKTNKTVRAVLSTPHSIDKCINKYFYGKNKKEEEKKSKEAWEYTIDQICEQASTKEMKEIALYLKSLTQALIIEDRLDRSDLSRLIRVNFKLDQFEG
jgi:hypothetical protein